MNNSVHRISLDIHDTASQSSINAKKGDTARSIYITLQENGKPYRIAEGCYAVLSGVKPDGNFLFNDCTIKDNVIIYDFTEQTVPVVGQVNCELILYDANHKQITSPHFVIIVNDVVYNDEEIVSSEEATALISATAEVKATTAEVEQKLANGDFVGEKGEKGEQGVKGDKGDKGEKGDKGDKGEDADPQLFANAVKGYAEGEVVRVDDVSPVEHIVNVKVDHVDPTTVTLTRCGKNLIPYPYVSKTNTTNGITFTDNGDGSVTINGTAIADAYFYLQRNVEYGGIINAISSKESATNGIYTASKRLYYNPLNKHLTINILSGDVVTNETIYPQLELGTIATDWEKPKEKATYTPNADGTVEGLTSLSPTMTLLTDSEGAVIHCEYNKDTNKALSSMQTADGTVVSQNADFAEVAEWGDGNPNNEDRTGYFVCADVPVHGIVMRKATSIDDVKGVSILAPAFAGNYSKDKLDSNGNLLPKYSYVAIIGFVPVRDNGTCEVGGRCMPDDNGCAIPSSNNMGYQVVNRIDKERVLIIIEPNGDMVQRIKAKIKKLQEDVDGLKPDSSYNPESANAQSGKAVAEALSSVGEAPKNYELIATITVSPDENGTLPTSIIFSADSNGNNFELTDFYVRASLGATDGTSARVAFLVNGNYVSGTYSFSSTLSATTLKQWYMQWINFGGNNGAVLLMPNQTVGNSSAYPQNSTSNTSVLNGGLILPSFSKYFPVKKIEIRITAGTQKTFIEGSKFELWGVRK